MRNHFIVPWLPNATASTSNTKSSAKALLANRTMITLSVLMPARHSFMSILTDHALPSG